MMMMIMMTMEMKYCFFICFGNLQKQFWWNERQVNRRHQSICLSVAPQTTTTTTILWRYSKHVSRTDRSLIMQRYFCHYWSLWYLINWLRKQTNAFVRPMCIVHRYITNIYMYLWCSLTMCAWLRNQVSIIMQREAEIQKLPRESCWDYRPYMGLFSCNYMRCTVIYLAARIYVFAGNDLILTGCHRSPHLIVT